MVLRRLDPEHLPNDYILNFLDEGFNHRQYFIEAVAALAPSAGAVEGVYLAGYLLTYFCFFVAVYRLAWLLFGDKIRAGLACVGLLVYANLFVFQYTPSGFHLMVREFGPQAISLAALAWALLWAIEVRHWLAALAVFVAALAQPLEGIMAVGAVALVAASGPRQEWRGWVVPLVAGATAVVAAVLAPIWVADGPPVGDDLFLEMVSRRAPYHYFPQTWPWWQWLFLALSSLGGTVALLRGTIAQEPGRRLALVAGLLAAGFAAGSAAIVAFDIITVMKLQIGKLLFTAYIVWGLALGGVVLGGLARRFATFGRAAQAALVAGVVAVLCLVAIPHRYNLGTPFFSIAIDRQITAYSQGNYRRWPLYVAPQEGALYAWLRAKTAPGDVVLHDPGLLRFMRVAAQRSSVVDTLNVLFSTAGTATWLQRIDALGGFCGQTGLPELAAQFGASWIVVLEGCAVPHGGTPVYGNGVFRVYPTP